MHKQQASGGLLQAAPVYREPTGSPGAVNGRVDHILGVPIPAVER